MCTEYGHTRVRVRMAIRAYVRTYVVRTYNIISKTSGTMAYLKNDLKYKHTGATGKLPWYHDSGRTPGTYRGTRVPW